MIDRPGPWGSGPFILADGHSSLDHEQVVIRREPFACTWLWRADRTPQVRLTANPHYWNRRRGPRLEEVVFRDLDRERALELVCTTEGEVDLVTEVAPGDAARVERSEHARLVETSGMRVVVGIFDRDDEDLPLGDRRVRQALNLAVDRAALVARVLDGRAAPLGGLTPPTPLTLLHRLPARLAAYPHDPDRARALWAAADVRLARPLRLAATGPLEPAARAVAGDLRAVLGVDVEVMRVDERETRRSLAARTRRRGWDVLLFQHVPQSADVPPHELHRGFLGETGEYRAGPAVPELERLYGELVRQTSQAGLVAASNRIDRFVRREALALFLYAPHALSAVNRHVRFRPYRTSLELAETSVTPQHWSRRG